MTTESRLFRKSSNQIWHAEYCPQQKQCVEHYVGLGHNEVKQCQEALDLVDRTYYI